MPELPEVEAVSRTLRPLVEGRRIRRCFVLHPIATKPQRPARLRDAAEGQRVRAVERRGKYLLLRLDQGLLTLHFKLDGQLLWLRDAEEFGRRANRGKDKVHADVAFELETGVLAFADRRHFGRVWAWNSEDECPSLARIGMDALSREFSAPRLAALLAISRRPVKEFLLDQSRVAGIGKIYSCEALWHARVSPRRRANRLRLREARGLHKAIVSVLRRALECCLDPAPDFRDPQWWFQGLESILRVYGREGKACRRCGERIRRIRQGGRSSFYCARCQR
jgi:formamidopyrimidine-DNA glycosylase